MAGIVPGAIVATIAIGLPSDEAPQLRQRRHQLLIERRIRHPRTFSSGRLPEAEHEHTSARGKDTGRQAKATASHPRPRPEAALQLDLLTRQQLAGDAHRATGPEITPVRS
jgi:hypothetical protein